MKTVYARPLLAAIRAVALVGGAISTAFGQDAPQSPQAAPAKTATPIVPVSLGSAKYNYRRSPRPFPNLLAPYSPIKIEEPSLTNSPRIDQLIHDGKLELSLQDAVELALENNMDIVLQRYNPWFADTGILKARAGGFGGVTPGAVYGGSTANNPLLNYDPVITTTLSYDDRNIPVNNPLTSGTGTGVSALVPLTLHTATYNTQYSQGFQTGTTFFTAWDNTRSSSSSRANLFNPSVQSSIFVGFQQQLLNGFGRAVNTRNIRITKNPLAPNFVNVEVIPTDLPQRPEAIEAPSFEEAVKEAFGKRPELQEGALNLQNGEIDIKATRNALLPTATLTAQYGTVGLAGNQARFTTATIAGAPVVDANGNPIPGFFLPATQLSPNGTAQAGFGDAMSSAFHNNFPDYQVSLNVLLPIRNRSAQADNQRSILTQRQIEAQLQQLRNAALLDVRNTYIALEQDRARVEAAAKARELQQQTFDAEQKKYQLGASTVYLVIQTQRDLIAAQGTELRALADLVEAKANYERAVGRTLEVNRVSIADAKSGEVERETLIPGTLHGQVVGTEKLSFNSGQR